MEYKASSTGIPIVLNHIIIKKAYVVACRWFCQPLIGHFHQMVLAFSGGTEQLPSMGITACFKAFARPVEQDNMTGKWLIDQDIVPAFFRGNHNQIVWVGPGLRRGSPFVIGF